MTDDELWKDLEAESRKQGPTMTITKAQYGALLAARSGQGLRDALARPQPVGEGHPYVVRGRSNAQILVDELNASPSPEGADVDGADATWKALRATPPSDTPDGLTDPTGVGGDTDTQPDEHLDRDYPATRAEGLDEQAFADRAAWYRRADDDHLLYGALIGPAEYAALRESPDGK